jgi:hypothetical protein
VFVFSIEGPEGEPRGSSERATSSGRGARKAMKEQVVADFLGGLRQQRATLAAREEETFGPPSPPTRHDPAEDLDALET